MGPGIVRDATPTKNATSPTLYEELWALMDQINVGKAALNNLSARFVNSTSLDARRELSIEQGRLQGETLSKRLALLYKVEECWPEIIGALKRDQDDSL